jgi:hypothetical protein
MKTGNIKIETLPAVGSSALFGILGKRRREFRG